MISPLHNENLLSGGPRFLRNAVEGRVGYVGESACLEEIATDLPLSRHPGEGCRALRGGVREQTAIPLPPQKARYVWGNAGLSASRLTSHVSRFFIVIKSVSCVKWSETGARISNNTRSLIHPRHRFLFVFETVKIDNVILSDSEGSLF